MSGFSMWTMEIAPQSTCRFLHPRSIHALHLRPLERLHDRFIPAYPPRMAEPVPPITMHHLTQPPEAPSSVPAVRTGTSCRSSSLGRAALPDHSSHASRHPL